MRHHQKGTILQETFDIKEFRQQTAEVGNYYNLPPYTAFFSVDLLQVLNKMSVRVCVSHSVMDVSAVVTHLASGLCCCHSCRRDCDTNGFPAGNAEGRRCRSKRTYHTRAAGHVIHCHTSLARDVQHLYIFCCIIHSNCEILIMFPLHFSESFHCISKVFNEIRSHTYIICTYI